MSKGSHEGDETSFRFDSSYQPGVVDVIYTDDEVPLRVLKVGDAFQSATYLGKRRYELPFEYFRKFDCLFEIDRELLSSHRILLLGAGACSYPKHALTANDEISMVAVERDPKVIELARSHFFLDELEASLSSQGRSDRFEVVISDALGYLSASDEEFAVIIDDLFDGGLRDDSVASPSGLELAREHIAPDGLFLMNYVCGRSPEDFDGMRSMMRLLKGVFGDAQALVASDEEFSDFDNYILAASAGSLSLEGAVAGTWD